MTIRPVQGPATPPVAARPSATAPASPAGGPEDGFAPARPVSRKPVRFARAEGLPRPASEAVSFLKRFDRELGLSPEAEAGKEKLMRKSALRFFRALPALFHADLAGPYASQGRLFERPAPQIPICGDLHGENLGAFRGPEGSPVWGLNDFDQATVGSPESDLDRLATGAALVARENGLSERQTRELLEDLGHTWIQTVRARAEGRDDGPPFVRLEEAKGPVREDLRKSASRDRGTLLDEWCEEGRRRFRFGEELQPLTVGETAAVTSALHEFLGEAGTPPELATPVRILDAARKLGSGGSTFGLDREWLLLEAADGDPILLEFKQIPPCTVHRQDGDLGRADARACLEAQRALGSAPNALSGALRRAGTSWLVREVEPEKRNSKTKGLGEAELRTYFGQAARVTARAHALTPERARALADWIGDEAGAGAERLAAFGMAYAQQVEADHREFAGA